MFGPGLTSLAQAQEVLKIGAPLAATGPEAREGALAKQGYDLWAETVNAHGGIRVGDKTYRVKIIYYDDQSKPQISAELTDKLISQDHVSFLLGPYGSPATFADAAIAERYGVPMVEANGAARKIFERGARAVIVKGGHMDKAFDVLFDGGEPLMLGGGEHVKTENTHGSGCTFASAIAAQLAAGRPLRDAILLAKAYVTKAIEKGFSIGKGPGPLDHFYRSHQEPPPRGVHEVPQHGMHPAAEPASR